MNTGKLQKRLNRQFWGPLVVWGALCIFYLLYLICMQKSGKLQHWTPRKGEICSPTDLFPSSELTVFAIRPIKNKGCLFNATSCLPCFCLFKVQMNFLAAAALDISQVIISSHVHHVNVVPIITGGEWWIFVKFNLRHKMLLASLKIGTLLWELSC